MNATPPAASTEYSRGRSRRRRGFRRAGRVPDPLRRVTFGLLLGALAGALLLLAAGFTTLFSIYAQGSGSPIKTVATGSHDPGLFPVAVVAAILAWAVWRAGSRPALLGVGLMGLLALVLALARDLPDIGASGLVMQNGILQLAKATAGPGAYLETAGAALLLISSGAGFLLLPAPASRLPARRCAAAGRAQEPEPGRAQEPEREHLF